MKGIRGSTDFEKEFLDRFNSLCGRHSAWQVWQDFVTMSAYAIANAGDKRPEVWKKREDDYLHIAKKYSKEDGIKMSELLGIVALALDDNSKQDFLGALYMRLNLGDHWKGQFFTPWSVSEMMAKMVVGDGLKEQIKERGYISFSDPCCGAGGMIAAFAAACLEQGVNYQTDVFFVGQDVDPVVAYMCYIQMSLLGCMGYVVIGDSLIKPLSGDLLNPIYEPKENILFTPLYFVNSWRIKPYEPVEYEFTKGPDEETIKKIKELYTPVPEDKKFSFKDFFKPLTRKRQRL